MGQVACLGAGAGQSVVQPLQGAVEVVHQGLHFGGQVATQAVGGARIQVGQRLAHGPQRGQAKPHLGGGGQAQQAQQGGQCQQQRAAQGLHRLGLVLHVGGHRQCPARAAGRAGWGRGIGWCGHGACGHIGGGVGFVRRLHRLLQHPQGLSGWPGQGVGVEVAVGHGVAWQGQGLVPQRARAQHGRVGSVVDLPVQAAVGLDPARVAQLSGLHHGLALCIELQPRHQLRELAAQFQLELPLHMLGEQAVEQPARQRQRQQPACQGGQQHPRLQRRQPAAHALGLAGRAARAVHATHAGGASR